MWVISQRERGGGGGREGERGVGEMEAEGREEERRGGLVSY